MGNSDGKLSSPASVCALVALNLSLCLDAVGYCHINPSPAAAEAVFVIFAPPRYPFMTA
jgi:hypothetical protein